MTDPLKDIDAQIRAACSAVEGAKAAWNHCPSADNAAALDRVIAGRDALLERRHALAVAEQIVRA